MQGPREQQLTSHRFQIGDKTHIISDGYYSICTLHEYIFEPRGWSLTSNEATGLLTLEKSLKQPKD